MISFCVFFGNKRHSVSTGIVWSVWTIVLDRGGRTSGGAGGDGGNDSGDSRVGRTSGGAGGDCGNDSGDSRVGRTIGGAGGDCGNDSGPRVIVCGGDGKITTFLGCLRRLTAQYIKKRITRMVKSPAIGRRTRQAVRSVSFVAVGMGTVAGI